MNTIEINKRLEKDYYDLISEGYEVFGVFLFGSQNYKCDIETSDIDIKAIVLPSFEHLVDNKGKITRTYKRDNGELMVFDMHSMLTQILKQNINFVEILFTNFFKVNPKYEDMCNKLREHREQIANANPSLTMKCFLGNFFAKQNKLFKSSPSNEHRILKAGYDYKALADLFRYDDFVHRFQNKVPYAECIIPLDNEYLRELKANPMGKYTPEQVSKLSQDLEFTMLDIYKKCENTLNTTNQIVLDFLHTWYYDVMRNWIRSIA